MKKNLLLALVGSISFLLLSLTVPAQDTTLMSAAGDRYLISAKAGGANFVQGTVNFIRKDGRTGYLLKGDQLNIGDRVTTGANGKAEILLNPGSYVRLGANSSFEFTTTSLDDLQLKLISGSAMFEVFASEDFKVTVESPKAKLFLVQSGIYRVDVLGDGAAKLSVIRGRAELDDTASTVVKGSRQVVVNSTPSGIAKFDTDDMDQLALWSKERSKELAKISQQVQYGGMRTSLMRSFLGRGWNMYSSFGLWAYDPFYRGFCFVPFGYWSSPYGWGFGPTIYQYNLPPVIFQPPPVSQPQNTPLAQTPRNPDGGIRTVGPLGGGLNPAPPFVKIQSDPSAGSSIRDGSIKGGRGMDSNIDMSNPNTSAPVYSPPSAPASAPSTTRADAPSKGSRDN